MCNTICYYIFSGYLALTGFLTDLLHRDEGASALEYALMAAMVAVPLVASVDPIGAAVTAIFAAIQGALTPGS